MERQVRVSMCDIASLSVCHSLEVTVNDPVATCTMFCAWVSFISVYLYSNLVLISYYPFLVLKFLTS